MRKLVFIFLPLLATVPALNTFGQQIVTQNMSFRYNRIPGADALIGIKNYQVIFHSQVDAENASYWITTKEI